MNQTNAAPVEGLSSRVEEGSVSPAKTSPRHGVAETSRDRKGRRHNREAPPFTTPLRSLRGSRRPAIGTGSPTPASLSDLPRAARRESQSPEHDRRGSAWPRAESGSPKKHRARHGEQRVVLGDRPGDGRSRQRSNAK